MAGSLMLINPRKRKASKKSRRKNPVRALRRGGLKRRRNPIAGMTGNMTTTLQGGAIGAAGAIGAKMVASFLPIPAAMKTGMMAPLVNALIGVALGMAVGKFASKKIGDQVGTGAVTIALYDVMRANLAGKLPGLSGSDDYIIEEMQGTDAMGAYDNMGAYDSMGETDDESANDYDSL